MSKRAKIALIFVVVILLMAYAIRAFMYGHKNPISKEFWGVSMYSAMPRVRLPTIGAMAESASKPRVLDPYAHNGDLYSKLAWVGSAMAYHVYDRQNRGGRGLTGFRNKGYKTISEEQVGELDALFAEELEKVELNTQGASLEFVDPQHNTMHGNTNSVCMVMSLRHGGRPVIVPAVCFAGTKDFENWSTDFTTSKMRVSNLNRSGRGQVHSGFAQAYNDAKSDVRAWAKEHDGGEAMGYSPLLVCGHSLGSALSEVCAYDLALEGHVVANFSMAPPRVGDEKWVKDYNEKVKYAMHFHVEEDPVPKTPPVSMGFRHTKNHFVFHVSKNIIMTCPKDISLYRGKCQRFKDPSWVVSAVDVASNVTSPLTSLLKQANCARLHAMPVYLQGVMKNEKVCPLE